MATTDSFLNADLNNQGFEFNAEMVNMLSLQIAVQNSVYLTDVIRRQIEIQHVLGHVPATENNSSFHDRIEKLNVLSQVEFNRIIAIAIKE